MKPYPEKTRKMFKQALLEMESDKVNEGESIPISRPRIKLLLSQMNVNDSTEKPKNKKNQQVVLLTGMPGKAEREMFGKMVIQEREKNAREQKNADMKQLFMDTIEQKRIQNEQRQQREEYRDVLKKTGGYVSASSSDAEGALQAIIDPFSNQDKGGEKKLKRKNTIEQKAFFD